MSIVLPIAGAAPVHAALALDDHLEGDPDAVRRAVAHAPQDDAAPSASQDVLATTQAQGLAQWLQQGPDLELGALPSRDLSSSAGAPKALPAIDPSPMDRQHVLELRADTTAGDWLSPTHAAAHKPTTATPPGPIDLPTSASQGQRGDRDDARD